MKRKPGPGRQWTLCFLALLAAWSVVGEVRPQGLREAQQTAGKDRIAQEKKAGERFAERAESLVSAAPVNKGEWGLLVVDAATGETLYEKNADRYFVPASNMKLLTSALALDKLGPDYRFRTTVETHGAIAQGVLSGDLILVGRGDPNLSNRKFSFDVKEEFDGPPEKVLLDLVNQVVARGVKEITGDIIGDDSYFPRDRYPHGWEIDDMVWEYGAAISAIVLDDNTVTLTLTPGDKAGDATVGVVEPATADFALENEVTTSDKAEKADLTLVREPGANMVVVTGTLPAKSAPQKRLLAIQEPAQHAASMLARLLAERGVKFRGTVRTNHEPDPAEASRTVLAEHVSLPLGDTLKLVNKISQNLHSEILLRTAARQQGRWTKPEELLKFPEEFYARAGIAPGDVVQQDGSGMSRHDLVTPRALAALLLYAQKQPWFPVYAASLPVAGIDGTLSDRMKKAGMMGRIHAKTGSIEHVQALSGYGDTPGGRRLIFSFFSNNESVQDHEVYDALDGLCLAMVEEFDQKK
jgi:D-alanyl-D-alanine carboxypeptidase/D-alanyl-D-alanine-endopeptidase (penicillin-binding protein 4)